MKLTKPNFLQEEEKRKLTGAEKGTVMHICMQKLDINVTYDLQKIEEFITNLQKDGIISQKEKESISVQKLYNYTQSNIWKELKSAVKIEREKPFYIQIPAKEIYEKDIKENILVQGVIDLYYINQNDELILVDYKTDYVQNAEQLIKRYREQLEMYKRALEESLEKKVNNIYIYSLCLQEEIRL